MSELVKYPATQVSLNNEVLLSVIDTTATEDSVLEGDVFVNAQGEQTMGKLNLDNYITKDQLDEATMVIKANYVLPEDEGMISWIEKAKEYGGIEIIPITLSENYDIAFVYNGTAYFFKGSFSIYMNKDKTQFYTLGNSCTDAGVIEETNQRKQWELPAESINGGGMGAVIVKYIFYNNIA